MVRAEKWLLECEALEPRLPGRSAPPFLSGPRVSPPQTKASVKNKVDLLKDGTEHLWQTPVFATVLQDGTESSVFGVSARPEPQIIVAGAGFGLPEPQPPAPVRPAISCRTVFGVKISAGIRAKSCQEWGSYGGTPLPLAGKPRRYPLPSRACRKAQFRTPFPAEPPSKTADIAVEKRGTEKL